MFEYCQHVCLFHCSSFRHTDQLLRTHTHTHTQPHTHMHRLRVQAENEIGRGPFSSYLSASTLHPPPSPPPLSLVSCTPNSLKLAWAKKPSKGLEYTLEMAQQGRRCVLPGFPGERGSHSTAHLTLPIHALYLPPPASPCPHTHTLILPIPSYTPPIPHLLTLLHRFHVVYRGTAINHRVAKLQPATDYTFRIAASSESGQGEWSDLTTFSTTPSPPRPPTGTFPTHPQSGSY